MWFHDGRPVDAFVVDKNTRSGSGLGHRYMRDLLTGQLRIANARLEDEGVWHCEQRDPTTGIVISTGNPTRIIVLGEYSFIHHLSEYFGRHVHNGSNDCHV